MRESSTGLSYREDGGLFLRYPVILSILVGSSLATIHVSFEICERQVIPEPVSSISAHSFGLDLAQLAGPLPEVFCNRQLLPRTSCLLTLAVHLSRKSPIPDVFHRNIPLHPSVSNQAIIV